MEENYVLLYGNKKEEDNICITNMFSNSVKIRLGWTDVDYKYNIEKIEDLIKKGVKQIIFSGLEIGWNKIIREIREQHKEIKIKVICNTMDSLLYYEYERKNFFDLLNLSKEKIIDDIAFFRKSQYNLYSQLGYECSYIMENYILKDENKLNLINNSEKINIGIYPLNYTWDKNIFNQLCIGKFIDNSSINYNLLDDRMTDFLETMEINSNATKIDVTDEKNVIKELIKNDINVSCAFTEYLHPIFFISMELGIPCIIGNTIDFFEQDDKIKDYILTTTEDNPIINAKIIENCLKNKREIMELYKLWKSKYNELSYSKLQDFLKK